MAWPDCGCKPFSGYTKSANDHLGAVERHITGSQIEQRRIDEGAFFAELDRNVEIADRMVLKEMIKQCTEWTDAEKPKT